MRHESVGITRQFMQIECAARTSHRGLNTYRNRNRKIDVKLRCIVYVCMYVYTDVLMYILETYRRLIF